MRIALADRLEGQRAVGDARNGDLHFFDVHRLQSETVRVDTRQDHAVTLEADIGRPVAKGDRHILIERQGSPVARRQARSDADFAIAAEGQAAKAQVRSLDGECNLGSITHVNIGAVVRLRVEPCREAKAGFRLVTRHIDRVAQKFELIRTARARRIRLSGL